MGVVGKVQKIYLPKEKGRVEAKACAWAGAQTQDLPHARGESQVHDKGFVEDKYAFPSL